MSERDFHDESKAREFSAFEEKLRAVEPSPPQTDWCEVAQLIEQSQKVVANSNRESSSSSTLYRNKDWLKVATHAAATLLGISIGVLWMLAMPPTAGSSLAIDPEPRTERRVVEEDIPAPAPGDVAPQELANRPKLDESKARSLSGLANRIAGQGPMTPMTRTIESRPRHPVAYEFRPVSLEENVGSSKPSRLDNPMSAPELIRELLN